MPKHIYGGRWEIVGSVGEGGQAHAFRVRDSRDGSINWILKRLKNVNRLERFRREVEALNALESPAIPKVVDFSVEYLAYHVTGDLGENLEKHATSASLTVDQSLSLFEQVASAVRDAHKSAGVVHRDIKPNNFIVSPDGRRANLIDFGICQYVNGATQMLTVDEAFGNPAFAAPECFLGRDEEPGPATPPGV